LGRGRGNDTSTGGNHSEPKGCGGRIEQRAERIARGKHVLLLLLIRADRGTATAATSGEKLVEGP
tara:strand:- start:1451 stop:1645 length:195 start_codon:yes stop_codon:yes gene_type:complete